MGFKSLGFREFKAGLQIVQLYISYISKYKIVPRPIILHWILTYSCNCKCIYCWRRNLKDGRNLLDKNQSFSLVDQAKELGVKYIAFTGGEPLLHDFIEELVSHVNDNGLGTILNTNGLCISENNCEFLTENFDYIVISVDTLNPQEFNKLKGIENSLDTVMNSIDILSKHMPRENLFVNILVHEKNINKITPMIKHFSSKKISVLMQPLHKSNDAKYPIKDESHLSTPDIGMVWDKVLDTIEYTDPIRKSALREYYQNFPFYIHDPKKLVKSFTCFAGSFSFFANPFGDIFTCEENPRISGNICESPLKDIWIKMYEHRKKISSKERDCVCWYQCSALNFLFLTNLFNNPIGTVLKEI